MSYHDQLLYLLGFIVDFVKVIHGFLAIIGCVHIYLLWSGQIKLPVMSLTGDKPPDH